MDVTSTGRLILFILLSIHTIRWTKSLSDIPVIVAGYGTASLCDIFQMFGDSVVVSKRRASSTDWRGDTSIKKWKFDCTTVKAWKLARTLFLCHFLHLPLTPSYSDPSVLLCTPFSPTLNTHSSLRTAHRLISTVRWFISHILNLMVGFTLT